MNARDTILDSVKGHLDRRRITALPEAPPVPLLGPIDLGIPERIERFSARLEAVGGLCHRGDPVGAVSDILAHHRPRTIAVSDASAVSELAQRAEFAELDWLAPDATKQQLFAADLGITAAQWGIAETGSVVLDSGVERSRLASLLPPVHVVLLPTSRVLCTLGELLKTLDRPLATAVTLITGPSRTADIELQLVLGVHGPRELHVILT